MNQVGQITFDGNTLEVYDSLDKPYFRVGEISKILEYSNGKTSQILELVEQDEQLRTVVQLSGQRREVMMVTELGLYNLLSQSKKPMARKWRRVIHSNLILLRRDSKLNIEEQFREWDLMADNLFIDEETGELMEFNTVAGGDVEVRPYVENK